MPEHNGSAPPIEARIVTITPEHAEQLLRLNTHNRGVNHARVDQYAADMRRGNWQLNGEAIKVASTGQVLDGQHRLMAILDADQPIQTLLITNLPPQAQETMDQGRARQLYDVLKLRGEGDYCALAAAVKLVCLYERDGLPYIAPFKASPTIHEALRTLERNPEIRDSVRLTAKHKVRWVSYSSLAALHYLFTIVDQEDADDFVLKLARGENLTAASPVWVLRERLIRDHAERGNRAPISPRVKLAFLIRTWNAYRAGDQIVRLTWQGGANADRFPRIEGLATPGDDDEALAA
jgi:hypothetical protein